MEKQPTGFYVTIKKVPVYLQSVFSVGDVCKLEIKRGQTRDVIIAKNGQRYCTGDYCGAISHRCIYANVFEKGEPYFEN